MKASKFSHDVRTVHDDTSRSVLRQIVLRPQFQGQRPTIRAHLKWAKVSAVFVTALQPGPSEVLTFRISTDTPGGHSGCSFIRSRKSCAKSALEIGFFAIGPPSGRNPSSKLPQPAVIRALEVKSAFLQIVSTSQRHLDEHRGQAFEVLAIPLNHHQLDLAVFDAGPFHLFARQFLDQRPVGVKVASCLLFGGKLRGETAPGSATAARHVERHTLGSLGRALRRLRNSDHKQLPSEHGGFKWISWANPAGRPFMCPLYERRASRVSTLQQRGRRARSAMTGPVGCHPSLPEDVTSADRG
jgi:hypothetical protein